jgi:hypothetical protein
MATSTNFNEASVSQRAMTLEMANTADQHGVFGECVSETLTGC